MQDIKTISISTVGGSMDAQFVKPPIRLPGVLLVHGWDSDKAHYRLPAEHLAELGCICLTFDMRGHGRNTAEQASVTCEDNLQDVLAAFDTLAAHPSVDPGSLALIGTSYGAYLAAIAATRAVRWLALRVPALYPDSDWNLPKAQLDREHLMQFRRKVHRTSGNRALSACASFAGDVLVVGSGEDEIVPEQTIRSYVGAFWQARSITHRTIVGADHGLSTERCRRAYDTILQSWFYDRLREMRSPSFD